MPTTRGRPPAPPPRKAATRPLKGKVAETLKWLERHGTKRSRDGLARYGIQAPRAFGVPMAKIQVLAKRLGRDHDLAEALWQTGWYEARLLTAFVAEPGSLTPSQMDRWCRGFDNWAVCDTLCFHLFDRTPHAFRKVTQWSRRREEFVRRAAFALLASLALHDKRSPDDVFARCLPLIEAAAGDERNFVKKSVNWALRAVSGRNPRLRAAALKVGRRLASSADPTARWVGKDAVRQLAKKG